MESPQQNVSEDGRTISPGVTRSMTFLDGAENSLPTDMVIEILSRMTSKSIARSRCVSRLWESILGSQRFTESFLAKSCARPQILFGCEDHCESLDKENENSKFLFFSSPLPQNPDERSSVVAANHLAHFPSDYHFFAHTDGFFCCGEERIVSIRNPTTGQSLSLPKLELRRSFEVNNYLGYEPIAKEFKVLSMTCPSYSDDWNSEEHEVLTLGTKNMSWRMVECCIPHNPSYQYICISGVLYYIAAAHRYGLDFLVVCFDLKSEKFSVIKFMEASNRVLRCSTATINYNGKLGLLMVMPEDSYYVSRKSKSFELWVLEDAGRNRWSKYTYVLPPLWVDSVAETTLRIVGMVGTSDIMLSPLQQYVPSYVIYYNLEKETITQVKIQGMEAFQGNKFYTFLNYVENVKLI